MNAVSVAEQKMRAIAEAASRLRSSSSDVALPH
jgi:hypothetical protein